MAVCENINYGTGKEINRNETSYNTVGGGLYMNHTQEQKDKHEETYSAGTRKHVLTKDYAIKYIVSWRVKESFHRLFLAAKGELTYSSSVIVLCSGEGMKGSILCDLGFTNVTVSDLT
jgi:hypothetical protein